MDSTSVVVGLALAGLVVFAVGAEAPTAYANVFDMMSDLIIEYGDLVGLIHHIASVAIFASLLAYLSAFFRGCLPTVASRVNPILESFSAGATRRAILVRESVIDAAWGFINALRSVTLAGILSWMLCRLDLPLGLLVLGPFIPAILRKYFLWKSWGEARLEDFVDFVCVDTKRQIERRRAIKSRELVYGVQIKKLAELNDEVAKLARKAHDTFRDALARHWAEGQYEELRPTEFTGRVAAVVPEEGPVPFLGLWFRLRHRIDLRVHWSDHTMRRSESAMACNQASIAGLEHQVALRSAEIRAIIDQGLVCRQRLREKWAREADPARRTRIDRTARQVTAVAPTIRIREGASTLDRIRAAQMRAAEDSRKERKLAAAASLAAAAAVDTPDSAAVAPSLPSLPAPPTPLALPAPPSSPSPEEKLAAAVATPLPKSRKETLLDNVRQSLEQSRA
ncbi:hypothetical protein C8A00DRAFT_41879 [Chaetomidium leptoderma]|uniref:Uncharacterized protein n=1 Tax=Chaetomidium leptoderma TaxID=669021 RepID=A0AAN6VPQ1_9PEZI|nr:hypothetical protein C8A00DRAFT_41879 [Chaetomidium leptoderma]